MKVVKQFVFFVTLTRFINVFPMAVSYNDNKYKQYNVETGLIDPEWVNSYCLPLACFFVGSRLVKVTGLFPSKEWLEQMNAKPISYNHLLNSLKDAGNSIIPYNSKHYGQNSFLISADKIVEQ